MTLVKDNFSVLHGTPFHPQLVLADLEAARCKQQRARHPTVCDDTADPLLKTYDLDTYIVEEYVSDEFADQTRPVDYKFHMLGSQVIHVFVCWDRRDGGGKCAHVDANFQRFGLDFMGSQPGGGSQDPSKFREQKFVDDAAVAPTRPRCWNAMVAQARQVGRDLNIYVRLDFYADARYGPVIGEACQS